MADFRRHLTELVPDEGIYYAHDDFDIRTQNLDEDERRNGHAHVKAMLLSATSHAIPVVAGEPVFGRWQRLILFEMDEPKERRVTFHVFGALRDSMPMTDRRDGRPGRSRSAACRSAATPPSASSR